MNFMNCFCLQHYKIYADACHLKVTWNPFCCIKCKHFIDEIHCKRRKFGIFFLQRFLLIFWQLAKISSSIFAIHKIQFWIIWHSNCLSPHMNSSLNYWYEFLKKINVSWKDKHKSTSIFMQEQLSHHMHTFGCWWI